MLSAQGLEWPVRKLSRVFHVGTMNPGDKGFRGARSTGPASPSRGGLADLGAQTRDGVFLEAHDLGEALWKSATDWAIQRGLTEQVSAYQACWFDDELGYEVCSVHDTRQAALDEVEEKQSVAQGQALRAIPSLGQEVGFRVSMGLAQNIVLAVFAQAQLPVDGVWWSDVLDPWALSAPRGVIFRTRLPRWSVCRVGQQT